MSKRFREGPGGYYLRSASDNSKHLRSRVVPSSLNSDNQRSKKVGNVVPPYNDQELTLKESHAIVRPYANKALKFYNEQMQTNYKLVEPSEWNISAVVRGLIHHINFTAKKKDVADAPVEMFFAELTTTGINILRVTTCQRLGPEKDLPELRRMGCCNLCREFDIYHPVVGRYKTGLENGGVICLSVED